MNVTFVENGTKVSALTPKTFVFVPEMSAGDPSVDQVTTVNIPAIVSSNTCSSLFTIIVHYRKQGIRLKFCLFVETLQPCLDICKCIAQNR